MANQNIGLTNALIGFAQLARQKGLLIGIGETQDALQTFDYQLFENKTLFYYALKTLFCTCKDDLPIFDSIFQNYWDARPKSETPDESLRRQAKAQSKPKEETLLSLWGSKSDRDKAEGKESKTTSGANVLEKIRKTDFSKLSEMEAQLLEELAEKLWRDMAKRLKRRRKTAHTKQTVDIRKTIRASLQYGGDPIDLKHKGQKPKRLRLVVLLDVSGSMDKYSFFLLRFVYALQRHFEKVESFIFSTELQHITPFLEKNGLEKTLKLLSDKADNWSSGTKIGASLWTFNADFAKHLLARSSLVIVLSDGLDTGEKGLIDTEVQKIRRRTKRLIWLNPLKGNSAYSPEARGMKEALPFVDSFRSAHSLESLLELEKILMHA